jgi:4-hydroxy-3-methylbut-2-enyl diphosphate reductase
MKIEKAEKLGLCFGVRRAIRLLKEVVAKHGEIETLGPIAHNRALVESLAQLGIKPVYGPQQVQSRVVAITTHGTSPAILAQLKAQHIQIVDATCPIVRRAQNIVRELAQSGFHIVIFGEEDHSEVKGLLGWAGDRGIAALRAHEFKTRAGVFPRLAIVSQTTQSREAFVDFAKEFVSLLGIRTNEIRVVDTLCQVIQAQQEAAIRLAHNVELMIVVGGKNSANSRRLVEICSPLVETRLVESDSEVDESWLFGKHTIGITAGASTPEEVISKVMERLRSLSQSPAELSAAEKVQM